MLCLVNTLHSQNLVFQNLTEKQGLSSAANSFVYKDKFGYVWISSVSGLNVWDGYEMKTYNPDENDPNAILGENIQSQFFEDTITNDIWFATYDGINKYIRSNDCFENFRIKIGNEIISQGYSLSYFDTQTQKLYISTATPLDSIYNFWIYDIKTKKQTHLTQVTGFRSRAKKEADGSLVFVFYSLNMSHGYHKVILDGNGNIKENNEVNRIRVKKNLEVFFANDIYIKNQSSIYVNSNLGLLHIEKDSVYTYETPTKSGLFGIAFHNNYLIVSSRKDGLFYFNIEKNAFTLHIKHDPTLPLGLNSNRVDELYIDQDNVLWVSSWIYGIQYAYLDKHFFDYYHFNKKEQININDFIKYVVQGQDSNIFVLFNQSGVFVYKDNNIKKVNTDLNVTALSSYGQNVLFITDEEIFISSGFPDSKIKSFFKVHPNEQIYSCKCKDEICFIATSKGIYKRYANHPSNVRKLLDRNVPTNIFIQDNFLVINSEYNKLQWMDSTTNFEIGNAGIVYAIQAVIPNNKYYIAGSKGLGILTLKNKKIQWLNSKQGFRPYFVNYMFLLQDSSLLLGTNKGILKYFPNNQYSVLFDTHHGLAEAETYFNVACFSGDKFITGSTKGINYATISSLQMETCNNFVRLDKIESRSSKYYQKLPKSLLPNERDLTFSVSIRECSYNPFPSFAYKLYGADHSWNIVNQGKASIRYQHLKPGKYTLELRSYKNSGEWSRITKSYNFTIKPYFYETIAFKLLIAILVMTIIYVIYQYQVKNITEKSNLILEKHLAIENERRRISKDMHDELGSNISAIHLLSDHIKNTISLEQHDVLANILLIEDSSKELNIKLKELIWMNEPREITVAELFHQLRLSFKHNINRIDFHLDPDCATIIIKPLKSKEVYLSAKETINNALKYTAGKIFISTTININKLIINIKDQGKGFDIISNDHYGHGIKNIKERIALIKDNVLIKSSSDGTEFIFEIVID